MRRRAWIAWGALAAAILLGILGRVAPGADAWNLGAGVALTVAIGLALTLIPLGRTIAPSLAPLPGLFERPGPNERWCASCGRAAPRSGACRHCGGAPAARRNAR